MLMFDFGDSVAPQNRTSQITFAEDQVFYLQRLSLLLLRHSGSRLRFRTLEELEELLAFAEEQDEEAIRSQLDAVRTVLPYRIVDATADKSALLS